MHFFKTFCIFSAFCVLPLPVLGYFGKTNEGQASFLWVHNLQSPRNVALEGSAGALFNNDPGVAILNPAALKSEDRYQVAASWQEGDLTESQGLVQFSHPLYSGRVLHSYGFVNNGEVVGYNEDAEPTGMSHYPLAQMYSVSWIQALTHFQLGITGRMLWERLSQSPDAQTGVAAAFDWGLIWNSPSPRYGVALAARHVGTQIRPFIKGGTTHYPLSSNLTLSGFLRPANLPRLVLLSELDAPRYSPVVAKLGGEYIVGQSIFLRGGIQRNVIDVTRQVKSFFQSTTVPNETGSHRLFSLGAGYTLPWLSVDYSYSHLFEGMGSEHRLGLRSGF